MQIIFTRTLAFQCFRRNRKFRQKNWSLFLFTYFHVNQMYLLVFVYGMELIKGKKNVPLKWPIRCQWKIRCFWGMYNIFHLNIRTKSVTNVIRTFLRIPRKNTAYIEVNWELCTLKILHLQGNVVFASGNMKSISIFLGI